MKTKDIFIFIFVSLILTALKIALLIWLYKIGYLLHYFIIAIVFGVIYYSVLFFTHDEKLNFSTDNDEKDDNKDKDAKKIEIEINNDKIIQKDSGEAQKVLKNISTEDITINNHENPPDEKQT
jgi:hypothetical protein